MATSTNKYKLTKPDLSEKVQVEVLNSNMDVIDSSMSDLQNQVTVNKNKTDTNSSNLSNHINNKNNPHDVTKGQLGLGNVENKSSAAIRGELTKNNVTNALGYTPYTPNEVDNKLAALETNIDWKESVTTFNDISTTYPNPQDGWTVNVKDTDITYRFNGEKWITISANAIPKATNSLDGLLSKENHIKYEDANSKKHTHNNKTILDGITSTLITSWNAAKTHADSAHARTDATKVEKSETNGNIKINGTETVVYKHPSGTNPHGTTKNDVGLNNVPNVKTNDQTPSYTESETLTKLTSGEKLSIAFGKISKAISDLISHIANKNNPHNVTKTHVGLGNVDNKSSATIREELTKENVIKALGYTPPTTDNNTWTANSKDNAGYVPKGDGNTNKYYGVDANGNPGWREIDIAARVKTRGDLSTETIPNVTGITMYEAYNNGYPIAYGNILALKGIHGGIGELLLGWSGTDKGIEGIYYRNKRDIANAMSEFRKLAFVTDNVASATKATQDGNGANIVSTYLKTSVLESGYRVKKRYTINLSSYASTNFYLVTFPVTRYELDCEVYTPDLGGSAAYNQNSLHFLLVSEGWSDTPKRLIILNHNTYASGEINIASIVTGTHNGTNGIYLRGGQSFEIFSNAIPTLRTAQYTSGDEVFPSGTATCYKTGFTNVDVNMDFTASGNTGKFTKFDGEFRAGSFTGNLTGIATKATQDSDGNAINATYLKRSGGDMTGAFNLANNIWNKAGDDVVFGDHNIAGHFCLKTINGTANTGITFYSKDESKKANITFNDTNFNMDVPLSVQGITTYDDINFGGISDGTFPVKSKKITWNGSTDGAEIYYQLDASDAGRLVINMKDDSNVRVCFALNGSIKSYIDANGNFSGQSDKALKDGSGNVITERYVPYSHVDNILYTGQTATNLKDFVEKAIMGSNGAIRARSGNVKIDANFIQTGIQGWCQFHATWQNHWNQNNYDINLNVLIYVSGEFENVYRVYINGKNGSYNIVKIVDLTPFEFGIDSNGNYGYKKVGADAVTPFLKSISPYKASSKQDFSGDFETNFKHSVGSIPVYIMNSIGLTYYFIFVRSNTYGKDYTGMYCSYPNSTGVRYSKLFLKEVSSSDVDNLDPNVKNLLRILGYGTSGVEIFSHKCTTEVNVYALMSHSPSGSIEHGIIYNGSNNTISFI